MGKYYSSSESAWEKEQKKHEKIGEGLEQLKQLDKLLDRAFEELENDPYGNMSTQNYNSQARTIQWCEDRNDALHNYTNEIHRILEEKEHDFCKELSKHFEELSLLNIEDYTTKNTLGITQKSNVATSYYGGNMASRSGEATSYEVRDVLKSNINIMDIQMKTNVLGLEEELREYLSKDDKKLTEAQLQDLKKDFYSSRMQTNFEHEVYSTDFWKGLSQTLDFVPVVGGLKNLIEGIAGYTMVGEKLTGNERVTYGLLGGISGVVDVFTLGTSSKILAAKKGLTKVSAQVLKREVLMQTSVSVTLGWTSQFASEKLRDMGLSSEEIFAIHILTGIAVVGLSKYAAGKKASVTKLDDLAKQTGLTSSQLDDIMKYTSKNADELLYSLKKGDLLDIIQGRNIDFIEVNVNKYDEFVSKGLKPNNSPTLESWKRIDGKIEINADGSLWKYTDIDGNFVYYRDGFPDFYQYKHPDIAPVTIKISKPKNNPTDFRAANEAAGLGPNTNPPVTNKSRPPEGYTWHHMEDGETMILINSDIHADFKHIGGQALINGKGG